MVSVRARCSVTCRVQSYLRSSTGGDTWLPPTPPVSGEVPRLALSVVPGGRTGRRPFRPASPPVLKSFRSVQVRRASLGRMGNSGRRGNYSAVREAEETGGAVGRGGGGRSTAWDARLGCFSRAVVLCFPSLSRRWNDWVSGLAARLWRRPASLHA